MFSMNSNIKRLLLQTTKLLREVDIYLSDFSFYMVSGGKNEDLVTKESTGFPSDGNSPSQVSLEQVCVYFVIFVYTKTVLLHYSIYRRVKEINKSLFDTVIGIKIK